MGPHSELRKETVPGSRWDHFRVSLSATTATQATATATPLLKGVEVKAAIGNTAMVYVGKSDLTNASAVGTDGFELGPGERMFLPLDDLSDLYLRTPTASQNVYLSFM